MNDYFEREILEIERELRNLKTSAKKSGGLVRTFTTTKQLNIPLEWSDVSDAGGYGAARATRYYEILVDYDSIIIPTLDWYFEDVTNPWYNFSSREIQMGYLWLPNGNFGVSIYIVGTEVGSNSDAARLKRGETVTVSVKLTATSTNDCVIQEYTM